MLLSVAVHADIDACKTELMDVDNQLFVAPEPGHESAWLTAIESWRSRCTAAINNSAPIFSEPDLLWTQTSYIQPQMHPYDRFFYEPGIGYTVDRFLNDTVDRYGGIDALLFWPTYTNIGVDDRNQCVDMCVDMRVGTVCVRAWVRLVHRHVHRRVYRLVHRHLSVHVYKRMHRHVYRHVQIRPGARDARRCSSDRQGCVRAARARC